MQVDKTTLSDLNIFHREEELSLFHHLNHTQTNDGREYLRLLLGKPLDNIEDMLDTQQTIRQLMAVADHWPTTITNGTMMVVEKFYDSQINSYPHRPDHVGSFLYKFFNKADYSLTRYTVGHCIDFVKGLNNVVSLLRQAPMSDLLQLYVTRIEILLNKGAVPYMMESDAKKLNARTVLVFGAFLKYHFKAAAFELFDIYSRLDAYLSLAVACKKYNYCFPVIEASAEPFIEAKGLYHPLLQTPVSYDTGMDVNRNFLFLTGANMGGKSTFIKAVGVSVYLAHLGMGVPARTMRLNQFYGLLSNIQVEDNIIRGESFFFNEVQRVRNTIEKISDGKQWLILIDELFKGTNVQDAMKCSTTVIQGLLKLKTALFILSTHLYEIGDELRRYPNIQFRYFETNVENDQLVFSYHLKEGISNDRLGYFILRKEGVVQMLENL